MKVVIAGYFPFPFGSASAARIRNFAQGLGECGVQVRVLAMAPMPRDADAPLRTPLDYQGVPYEKMAAFDLAAPITAARRWPKIRNRVRWLIGLYGSARPTYQRLKALIDAGQCDLLICYGRNAALLTPLVRLCHQRGSSAVLDITEIPEHFPGWGGRLSPIYWDSRLGTETMPKRFDVLSVITHGLKDKYRARGCRNLIVIPSIETWQALPAVQPNRQAAFRLIYVGALIDRDAPDLLFEAVRELRRRGLSIELEVIGRFENNAEGRRRAAVCRLDPVLRECVNLIGEVSDGELTDRLSAADGLILMRRDAPTEVCAFPTRLVEYLKQGRPVFISDVGDVACYLRNGIDAMLLSPTDARQVADAIHSIVAQADRGYALGLQGRQRGAECFDRRVYAQRLIDQVANRV